jgi:hypothetical protein
MVQQATRMKSDTLGPLALTWGGGRVGFEGYPPLASAGPLELCHNWVKPPLRMNSSMKNPPELTVVGLGGR